jgi:hypothetical protein
LDAGGQRPVFDETLTDQTIYDGHSDVEDVNFRD